MRTAVLRLGHRYMRDKRISTHIGLVARAFGADKLILDTRDPEVEESISQVVSEWGSDFNVEVTMDWRKYIQDFRGDRIHLTMYGININQRIQEIGKTGKDKLIIVGGKKVPSEVYSMVDYNVAVGNQPHSEVAALAVFLDRLFNGEELERRFKGKKKVIPQEHGKKILEEP